MNIIPLILWAIVGVIEIINESVFHTNPSKFDYWICYICLMVNLIGNVF